METCSRHLAFHSGPNHFIHVSSSRCFLVFITLSSYLPFVFSVFLFFMFAGFPGFPGISVFPRFPCFPRVFSGFLCFISPVFLFFPPLFFVWGFLVFFSFLFCFIYPSGPAAFRCAQQPREDTQANERDMGKGVQAAQ